MRHIAWLFLVAFMVACGSGNNESQEQQTPGTEAGEPDAAQSDLPGPQSPANIPEDKERTEWQNPELVLQRLGDLEDKTVADLGAGSGYFTFKLALKAKKVIALDIDPRALEYIREQMDLVGEWSGNIEPRLTPADVPNLVANEVDAVLIVNTFLFVPDKESYLPRLLDAMKPGGRLAIVDFKKGVIPVGPTDDLKFEPAEVERVLKRAGFKKVSSDTESLQFQFIVTAEK